MFPDSLSQAVLATVVYADIFDQPLTPAELHRYLHGCRIERTALDAAMEQGLLDEIPVEQAGGHLALAGREDIVTLRGAREQRSAALRREARRYNRIAARLPYVRMLALTGALAMRNAGETDDIDYFVITEPGRIWTSRLFFILLVKTAARRGITLCPNYFLDAGSLALDDHSLFTARELAQMVPLSGLGMYARMRAENAWADDCLSNAAGPPDGPSIEAGDRRSVLLERSLSGRIGDRLEAWEQDRKIRKLSAGTPATEEIVYDAHRVQGHTGGYRARTLAEFERRMEALL